MIQRRLATQLQRRILRLGGVPGDLFVAAAQRGAQKCASCASRRAIRAPDRYDARAHCNGCAKRMVKAPRGAGAPFSFRDL